VDPANKLCRSFIIDEISKLLSGNASDQINVLSLGCRNKLEIEFLNSIDSRIKTVGIDLCPNTHPDIYTGNVENFILNTGQSIVSFFKQGIDCSLGPWGYKGNKIDLVFSSHNLEHLSNPFLHFQNLLKVTDKNTLFYFILPCWNGGKGPTPGHPNFIKCTQNWDTFTAKNFQEYLYEVTGKNANVLFTIGNRDVASSRHGGTGATDLRVCFKFSGDSYE